MRKQARPTGEEISGCYYICNYALAAEEISGCIIYVISLFIIEIEMWWMHLFLPKSPACAYSRITSERNHSRLHE
uniref:Uncharacterized protein n=1 Tax=Picea glauca TaxID=3330 RepID=A0A101M348_PICGL|nr:hypothetical protein ABT39_MTgene3193 [Picea glauca]